MKIAIIIVLYKTPQKEIDRLTREIRKIGLKDCEMYFIDNTNNNRGYAAAANTGIRRALIDGAELFIIANPDISFRTGNHKKILAPAKYFDIWGWIIKQQGKTYYGGKLDPWTMSGGLINKDSIASLQNDIDFVSGSLMFVKKKVIEKIGFFDESYFMYYEDVDYCFRAKQAGFKIGIDMNNSYEHFEQSQKNPKKSKLLAQSLIKFQRKYGNIRQKGYLLAKRIITSRFLISFFSLNLSSLAVRLFNFVNFLFLVRFLTVTEYGIYTLVWAQVSLLAPLADFGTTSYGIINLPTEKESRFRTLVSLRFFLSLAVFFLTIFVAMILFSRNFKVLAYILVTSAAIFSNMASGSYFIWNAIREKIYISSRNSLIFNFLLVATIIIGLILTKRLMAVFIIIFIFYSGYTLINFGFLRRELNRFILKMDFGDWLKIIRKSYIFVLIAFFGELYFNLDVFLLKLLKGESAVGIYSAGYKFFEALLFTAASYNVTAAPVFARLATDGKIFFSRIRKDLAFMSLFGLTAATGVFFLAPVVLPLVLKGNYQLSIPVLKTVIFALPLVLINSVFLNIIYVLKKAYWVILVFAMQTTINVSLNLVFIPRYSYQASAAITVISEITNLVILVIFARIVWKKYYENRT